MSFDIREHNLPLPNGWTYKRIGDIAQVNSDTIKKKDAPEEIYYLDISSVSNGTFEPPKKMLYSKAPSRAKRRVKKNDFIISTVRPNLRQYAFLDEVHENWVVSTGFAVVSALEAGTEWYLYSVLTSDLFNEHLVRVADGGAYPAFNPKEIEDAIIHWPDKRTLELINALASHLNKKQKVNFQTNQTLEQIGQAIFKSWFVDFDPVKAKIAVLEAGGTAEQAELAAMSAISAKDEAVLGQLQAEQPEVYAELAQTAALFPSALVDSELGELPEGWNVVTLSALVELNSATWSKKNAPLEIEYVDLSNTKLGVIHSTERFMFNDAPSRARRALKPNDTIIGTVRPGNGSFAYIKSHGLTGSTGFAVLSPREVVYSEFIYVSVTSEENIKRLAHLADGAAYPAVNPEIILSTKINLPSELENRTNLLEMFHKLTNHIFAKRESNFLENALLSSISDSLLPKLLSGDIPIPETNEATA